MTTQNLKMDLIPGGAPKLVRVSQYDNESRSLIITLTHDEKSFTIPTDVTVEVRGTKPSGKGFHEACAVSGNVVTVVIKDTMTDESGRVRCELLLTKGSVRLGSAKFELEVDRDALDPDAIIKSDSFEDVVKDAVRECANEQLIELTVDMELNNESDNPVANKVVSNLFASALKGLVYGSEVTADDISPVKHNLDVRAHGKNLIDITKGANANLKVEGDVVTMTRNADAERFSNYIPLNIPAGLPLTASFKVLDYTKASSSILFQLFGESGKEYYVTTGNSITKTYPERIVRARFYLQSSDAVGSYIKFEDPQFELGDTATDYEPWVDPSTLTVTAGGKTFTPDNSGNVEGLTSDMLAGGISVNNNGIVDCEYNRDLTKVIEKLTSAIVALGGNV